MCNESLPIEDFSINDKKRGYRRPECKPCHSHKINLRRRRREGADPELIAVRKEYHSEYYKKMPDDARAKWREHNRLSYHKMRDEIYKGLGNQCARCGNSDRAVLQVDHIHGGGGKERLDLGVTKSYRILRDRLRKRDHTVRDEFQILCANCHNIKTTTRR